MYPITARQIKAARELIGLSQEALAHSAGVGVTTLRNLESGSIPRGDTLHKVRFAMESSGVDFIGSEGVRLRDTNPSYHRGTEGCETLFQDIVKTVVEQNCDIIVCVESQKMLLQLLDFDSRIGQEKLQRLGKITRVKCLISEVAIPLALPPSFQFRTIHKNYLGPFCYFIYGDREARVLIEGDGIPRINLYRSVTVAHTISKHFLALWDLGMPLLVQVVSQDNQQIIA